MFSKLSQQLGDIFDRLRKRGALTEADVDAVLREVRIALLEADVALSVIKDFLSRVKQKAIGQDIFKSITPGQMVVKIVHDELIATLGGETSQGLNLAAPSPLVMMMVGLQGSGKTTTTAKIARFLKLKKNKKVLMASVDIYRPAAQKQLEILGAQHKIDTLDIQSNEVPLDIIKRAQTKARLEAYDILLIDTAGRLHIDEALMAELIHIRDFLKPIEILLIADAMTGQDAVSIAHTFHEKLELTGTILTRIDGDARGGAALSIRHVTGCPIKFVGTGERIEQLEEFHPDRIASRILDVGDVVSLVEKAAETINQEEAEAFAKKMSKGQFNLDDLAKQLKQFSKMGSIGNLLSMIPGISKFKDQIQQAGMNEKLIARQLAMISSMTPYERANPKILNGSRRKRIAAGAGTNVADLNRLLKQFEEMKNMMKKMNKLGQKGLKRQGLRGLFGR